MRCAKFQRERDEAERGKQWALRRHRIYVEQHVGAAELKAAYHKALMTSASTPTRVAAPIIYAAERAMCNALS